MKMWKRASISFLIVAMGALTAACGKTEEAKPAADSKKIVAVTHAQFPPFEYMSPDGKPEGFDVDVIKAIGKEVGLDVDVQDASFDGAQEQVKSGKAQIAIAAITINDKRKKQYAFSDPYFEAKQLIMVPEGSPVKSLKDVKDKRVGVQLSTTGALIAEGVLGKGNVNLKQFDDLPSAMDDLYNKRIDVVIGDNVPMLTQMKKTNKPGFITIEDPSMPKENYGIMMNQNDKAFVAKINEGLKKIKQNGTYSELYKKYFGQK
ncbi:amino acid ABC transporter substrate-binding protein (PAAT family) [Aneurinibacillus soli]|uniref:Glutamine-binding periplasmic protein n=1 Tax=Aneurinibacillus soli TaxID=1500254 RepID=A0A0U5AYE3_9BACL|nr:transporter substrate-binding domain-containing protein [Aneurinibacillus soli]PYE60318.1 amino acid ABC transporter substrate-binding protein (PAAT family) [Aneurinibacillus soli]BAU27282.1 Glutamine-binding periplasmic protein precursor [Aneurinibacillus soli]